MEDSKSFDLTFKNPCIDTAFVSISVASPTLADQTYIVSSGAKTLNPNDPFTIKTIPI